MDIPQARAQRSFGVVLIVGALSAGCGSPLETIWSAPSPDDKAVLLLERKDFEGAFGDFDYEVIVARGLAKRGTIWKAAGCQPRYLFWISETEIELLVDADDPKCRGLSRGPEASGVWQDYQLVVRPMPGRTKSSLLQEPRIGQS